MIPLSLSPFASTDGSQAKDQLGDGWTLMKLYEPGVPELHDWVLAHLKPGDAVGVDPTLVSAGKARDPGGPLGARPICPTLLRRTWLR